MKESKYRVIEIEQFTSHILTYNVQKREHEDYQGGGSSWVDIVETYGFSKDDCIAYINSKIGPVARVVYEV